MIRGYTNCNFEAWTVPCLYVAGKYLRVFAIKADQTSTSSENVNTYDEVNPDAGQNEKLEDAARTLNKMFQVCLGDRYVHKLQSAVTAHHCIDPLWKNRGNGAYITSLTYSLKHTLSLTRYHFPRIS